MDVGPDIKVVIKFSVLLPSAIEDAFRLQRCNEVGLMVPRAVRSDDVSKKRVRPELLFGLLLDVSFLP
ncbi:hypothetical protein D3C86_1839740 [compost metagenome]